MSGKRAQRLAASLRLAVGSNGSSWASSSARSTPCGVTAVGGRLERFVLGLFQRVLNALRRHCGWRDERLGEVVQPNECSTPCGVTAVGGSAAPDLRDRAERAQRLAASLRLAEHAWRLPRGVSLVLNALRRHCGWRCVEGTWATTPMCSTPCGVTAVCGSGRRRDGPESSAQRLAASLRLADTFAAAPPFAISR